ncbi:lipoprotein 17-related variable surface protein [[Mycoplasma] anseris]|uniref:Lipoprotein-associated type-17 domain-containing protein n=1 Tax=[Mycoplasma] anseris TaxID=92400 RepID=A0A2Z4NDR2_9BACT|nr:lipoprotein 17-related variable surface protein [[Mycoplasma] anseris]AWX69545.1 hypothetical protein DP065_02150 [[Mycoplasma] anseris]
MSKKTKVILGILGTLTPLVSLPIIATKCEKDKPTPPKPVPVPGGETKLTKVQLNEELNKIKISVAEKVTGPEVVSNNQLAVLSGFDAEKVNANIIEVVNVDDTNIKVKVEVVDKKDATNKSDAKEINVVVFSSTAKEQELKAVLNAELEKVTLGISDATKTGPEIQDDNSIITASGHDETKAKLKINEIQIENDTHIKVVYTVTNPNGAYTSDNTKEASLEVYSTLQKELDAKAETLTAVYSKETLINAIGLQIADIKVKDGEADLASEYAVNGLAFVNKEPTEEEINTGKRLVSFSITKDSKTSKVVQKSVQVEKSNKAVILDQKEKIKTGFELIDTYKSIETLEALEEGTVLSYDYKTFKVFSGEKWNSPDRVDLFKLKDNLSLDNLTKFYSERDMNTGNKVVLHKVAKGQYEIKFYIGNHSFNKEEKAIDVEQLTITGLNSKLLDKAALDALLESKATEFVYSTKTEVYAKDANEEGITKPEFPEGVSVLISNLTKNASEGSITFNVVISTTDAEGTSKSSDPKSITISEFKQDSLGTELEGLTVDYTTKTTKPSETTNIELITVKKGEADYNPEGITVSKEIVAAKANDVRGEIVVKITLTKDSQSTYKEFTIGGFTTSEFNLDDFVNGLTIELQNVANKAETLASSIKESNINVVDPKGNTNLVTISHEFSANNETGSLTVTTTITKDSETKTKTTKFTGFKIVKSDETLLNELREAAAAGTLLSTEGIYALFEQASQRNKYNAKNGLYVHQQTLQVGVSSSDSKKSKLVFPLKFQKEEFNSDSRYAELLKANWITSISGTQKAMKPIKQEDGSWSFSYVIGEKGTTEYTFSVSA